MYDTILVPTDGSDDVETVVEHAVDVAAKYDATVHALFVADRRITDGVPDDAMHAVAEALEEEGAEATAAVEAAMADADVAVEKAIEPAVPHQGILNYAVEEDIDLIVMGTHGASGPAHGSIGSVAERVVRRSPVPVHVVPIADGDTTPPIADGFQ